MNETMCFWLISLFFITQWYIKSLGFWFCIYLIKCLKREETTEEVRRIRDALILSTAWTAVDAAARTRPSRGSRWGKSLMNHREKILRTTLLTKLITPMGPSICQSCTSNNNTVFHVASMQELSESDLKLEETETPDTPQSSEMSRMMMLRPVDLLFQLQIWAESETCKLVH